MGILQDGKQTLQFRIYSLCTTIRNFTGSGPLRYKAHVFLMISHLTPLLPGPSRMADRCLGEGVPWFLLHCILTCTLTVFCLFVCT